ncbi:PEP-CTERM-box response regulator transcription factor [Corallincola luteus]|uniref:PEP-CTERM-box response regulator transcription factor n=3 Tax=Corallincola TaxID=1775176 RepID=A0A368N4R9_9GAMM|nr:PEP-CTERM-box response regulator transcription factor [Corallincola holothuriorum]RCU45170.1 PEP-CTERM-box response regulator transcription factor [Corallincola holothuriorum]TAA46780.1 PEP-CTERM-box response regulator transcription factor [Corallincola spongiicola]TCI04425.1 PEP-CTERM-box response regulator transcription factor [Corallincola luteus]
MVVKKEYLLIVDDDPGIQKQLKWSLDKYNLVFAEDRASAIKQLRRFEPAVVTLDLGLPPDPANASEGLMALSEILALSPSTKVIVVTGNDDKDNALRAVADGAYDYYHKPIDPDVLQIIIDRAFQLHRLEDENRRLVESKSPATAGIIGNSPEMTRVLRLIERVAPTEATALLLGESGTGKEVFARAIHQLSPRRNAPFIAINCASIPENLLESELFGFEKGAFTGAHKKTQGKIECAQGGTLFLDEIGDMPGALQAKLLRFLQERVIEPVGGRTELPVDVRVVCATNRDLKEMVESGEFREDLFYRISEITFQLPALREREGDVVLLARSFLHNYNSELGRNLLGFNETALKAICSYSWPGNIRELQNKVKSAAIMADSKLISAEDLGLDLLAEKDMAFNLRAVREEAEKKLIFKAFSYTDYNISRSAELLGVTRPTLYSLMDKYNITDERNKRAQ